MYFYRIFDVNQKYGPRFLVLVPKSHSYGKMTLFPWERFKNIGWGSHSSLSFSSFFLFHIRLPQSRCASRYWISRSSRSSTVGALFVSTLSILTERRNQSDHDGIGCSTKSNACLAHEQRHDDNNDFCLNGRLAERTPKPS